MSLKKMVILLGAFSTKDLHNLNEYNIYRLVTIFFIAVIGKSSKLLIPAKS